MSETASLQRILIMGVGNTLQRDDGIGIHVAESLRALHQPKPEMEIIDGGTIGLSLLPQIEDAGAVIIVDASEIGEKPGTIRVFCDEEIDRQISGKRRTVHEVALADLFSAAAIRGRVPAKRALVAIQPASTDTGVEPTPEVRAAIPRACDTIDELTYRWRHEA